MMQINRRWPVRMAQMAARMINVVFPLPRGIARALSIPTVAARSMASISRRWSSDHSSVNALGKQCSRKKRSDRLHCSRSSPISPVGTGGGEPISRPAAEMRAADSRFCRRLSSPYSNPSLIVCLHLQRQRSLKMCFLVAIGIQHTSLPNVLIAERCHDIRRDSASIWPLNP